MPPGVRRDRPGARHTVDDQPAHTVQDHDRADVPPWGVAVVRPRREVAVVARSRDQHPRVGTGVPVEGAARAAVVAAVEDERVVHPRRPELVTDCRIHRVACRCRDRRTAVLQRHGARSTARRRARGRHSESRAARRRKSGDCRPLHATRSSRCRASSRDGQAPADRRGRGRRAGVRGSSTSSSCGTPTARVGSPQTDAATPSVTAAFRRLTAAEPEQLPAVIVTDHRQVAAIVGDRSQVRGLPAGDVLECRCRLVARGARHHQREQIEVGRVAVIVGRQFRVTAVGAHLPRRLHRAESRGLVLRDRRSAAARGRPLKPRRARAPSPDRCVFGLK